MIFGKIDRYLLIAIVVLLAICLYFLFINHKGNAGRDSLLIAMAEKLHATVPSEQEEVREKIHKKIEKSNTPTEEEEADITSIADKLCFSKELDAEEEEFKKRFPKEINDELENSKKVLSILIGKFLGGVKEFTDFEKEFYEANKAEIDEIVHNRIIHDSVIKKLTAGITDFSAEELQFQANYADYIEKELAKIKRSSEAPSSLNFSPGDPAALQGANPPTAADERLRIILTFFENQVPKTVTDLAKLYAEATSTKFHTGNRSADIGKLVDEGKLMCTKAGSDKKIYHGLPSWFEGKKLKEEYRKNIPA